jgi:hypothetical protein
LKVTGSLTGCKIKEPAKNKYNPKYYRRRLEDKWAGEKIKIHSGLIQGKMMKKILKKISFVRNLVRICCYTVC